MKWIEVLIEFGFDDDIWLREGLYAEADVLEDVGEREHGLYIVIHMFFDVQ